MTFDPESGLFDVVVRADRTVPRTEVLRRILAHGEARGMGYMVHFVGNRETSEGRPEDAAARAGHLPELVERGVPFTLPDLEGRTHRFEPGERPTVIVFWASWCEPCLIEAPHLARLYREHGPDRLAVLGVSIDEAGSKDTVMNVVRDLDLPYPVLLDPDGSVLARYADEATIPLTIVLDASGAVRYHHGNFQPGDEQRLGAAIADVLRGAQR